MTDYKKINLNNVQVKDIKETASDMVNQYIKRYDKVGI